MSSEEENEYFDATDHQSAQTSSDDENRPERLNLNQEDKGVVQDFLKLLRHMVTNPESVDPELVREFVGDNGFQVFRNLLLRVVTEETLELQEENTMLRQLCDGLCSQFRNILDL